MAQVTPKPTTVTGDLLESKATFLVHQTNCVTTRGRGLSAAMFRRFPQANVYRQRGPRTPGTVKVIGRVVNLFGQHRPGKAPTPEIRHQRLRWFQQGLEALLPIVMAAPNASVAFPYRIGCGLAGGSWPAYQTVLNKFAADLGPDHPVYIVRRRGD